MYHVPLAAFLQTEPYDEPSTWDTGMLVRCSIITFVGGSIAGADPSCQTLPPFPPALLVVAGCSSPCCRRRWKHAMPPGAAAAITDRHFVVILVIKCLLLFAGLPASRNMHQCLVPPHPSSIQSCSDS